jgi:hypothetical protein
MKDCQVKKKGQGIINRKNAIKKGRKKEKEWNHKTG